MAHGAADSSMSMYLNEKNSMKISGCYIQCSRQTQRVVPRAYEVEGMLPRLSSIARGPR